MCGLFAIAQRGSTEPRAYDAALKALERRGPDGHGIASRLDGRLALGHTRLAIIDVEGGAQPITSEDGRVVLAWNGELYGHAGLRRALEARGHTFRTRVDAEVALHLYLEHGVDGMLERLRGEYAFALFDERTRTLIAARDRFGIKPLVYSFASETLILASNAKALFALGVPARWDATALHAATSMQYTPPDRTLFDRVSALRPGHVLSLDVDRAKIEIRPYWDLDYPITPSPLSMAEASDRVRTALEDAVDVRLVADVPIAFQLSGGIDSAAVVALAARHLERISAFTVAFDDEETALFDEREVAREMARHVGAELSIVHASPSAMLDRLPAAIIDGEGLAVNAHIAAKHLLAASIRDAGFKVVLTGEGADEVFAGYAHLRCDLDERRAGELASMNQASLGLMMPHGREALDTSAIARALGFVPTWLRAKAGLGHQVSTLLRDDWRREHSALDPFAAVVTPDVVARLQGRGRVEQSLYLWSKLALEGYILRTLGDGMEMSASIEGRLPFLDHHLFDVVRQLPTELKIQGAIEKAVLREAVGPLITERVRARRKHPFLAPPLLARTSPPDILFDVLKGSLAPMFDRARVSSMLDRLRRGDFSAEARIALEPVLMLLLSASIQNAHYRLG